MQVPGKLLPFTINCSAPTSSPRTQEMLALRLAKTRKGDARALTHTHTHSRMLAQLRLDKKRKGDAHPRSLTHTQTHAWQKGRAEGEGVVAGGRGGGKVRGGGGGQVWWGRR